MYFQHKLSNRKEFGVSIGAVLVGADYVRLRWMETLLGWADDGKMVKREVVGI